MNPTAGNSSASLNVANHNDQKVTISKNVQIDGKNYTVTVRTSASLSEAEKDKALEAGIAKIVPLAIAFKMNQGKTQKLTLANDKIYRVTSKAPDAPKVYSDVDINDKIKKLAAKFGLNDENKEQHLSRLQAFTKFMNSAFAHPQAEQNKPQQDGGADKLQKKTPPTQSVAQQKAAAPRAQQKAAAPQAQQKAAAPQAQQKAAAPEAQQKGVGRRAAPKYLNRAGKAPKGKETDTGAAVAEAKGVGKAAKAKKKAAVPDVKSTALLAPNITKAALLREASKKDLYMKAHTVAGLVLGMETVELNNQTIVKPSPLSDIHSTTFQNQCLEFTEHGGIFLIKKLAKSDDARERLISRTCCYAIGSRNDVSWDGKLLTTDAEKQKKQKEMEANWQSIAKVSYGSTARVPDTKAREGTFQTKINVINEDTLKATSRLIKDGNDPKFVSFLNMANRKFVGGGYQTGIVAQEEYVAPATDSIVTLGNLGVIDNSGRARYKRSTACKGNDNYFLQTKLLLSKGQPTCNTIVHGFRDWRVNMPASEKEREVEIKADMRAVLRTALENKQECLVLGASGCGAFKHNPQEEAKAWKSILEEPEFKGHFKEIVFAIIGSGENLNSFQAEFNKQA